jgi:hypothetical protein
MLMYFGLAPRPVLGSLVDETPTADSPVLSRHSSQFVVGGGSSQFSH